MRNVNEMTPVERAAELDELERRAAELRSADGGAVKLFKDMTRDEQTTFLKRHGLRAK